jgi:aryl-alcohol dehydrogenase-like predicted oxidoreductase
VGELAIAWLLGNPLVCSVIAGAVNPDQVVANIKGTEWHLTPQEILEVEALLDGQADPMGG